MKLNHVYRKLLTAQQNTGVFFIDDLGIGSDENLLRDLILSNVFKDCIAGL